MKLASNERSRLTLAALALAAAAMLAVTPVGGAVIGADGGITLWISYDNLDVASASLDDTISEADGTPGSRINCTPTNDARSAAGAPNSPPSCPGRTGSCTAREKIEADIDRLADYIYLATEGAHYLRRVYISDRGRAWGSADIDWNMGLGGSSAPTAGWADPDEPMSLQSAYRTCIHDVVHHELGHYFYRLPDRYDDTGDYYWGRIDGGPVFNVDVTTGDPDTVMSYNFPHRYVDTTNARIVVDYHEPGSAATVGEVLTPALLSDADPDNDGPDRAHHEFTNPFAQDEWSLLPLVHADLAGVHTEGAFPDPGARPDVDIEVIGDDGPHPGIVLLLDRSGSMAVTTDGIPAAQFVQEAGMFLYHSSEPTDLVGTSLYNESVEELFPYAAYDPTNDLPFVSFRVASGMTDIAAALEGAIDTLLDTHGEGGVAGAEIYLLSDGRQTTGDSLWDQVTRANTRGIRINTFSFGDADAGVMDAIAGGTSGDAIQVSERQDGAELKLIMARKLATGRGSTPVFSFKGLLTPIYTYGSGQAAGGTFDVPPKSRSLKFYAFLRAEDASELLSLALVDPNGVTVWSSAPDNVVRKGRFNAVNVDAPVPGTWSWWAFSKGGGLPDEPVELVAYADNRELRGRVWFDDVRPDGRLPAHAKLFFRYPLSGLDVTLGLYRKGWLIAELPMADDGADGIDLQAGDGIYSAVVDLADLLPGCAPGTASLARVPPPKALRAEARFQVTDSSGPAPHAIYEAGVTPEMVDKDYARANRASFAAWASGVVNLADLYRPDGPRVAYIELPAGAKAMPVGRGQKGSLRVRLFNLQPVPGQLRVSLGAGVEASAAPDPDAAPDDPAAGVPLRVGFAVAADAEPGPRGLTLQFQDRMARLADVIVVGTESGAPAGRHGRLLPVLIGLLLLLWWLRRQLD